MTALELEILRLKNSIGKKIRKLPHLPENKKAEVEERLDLLQLVLQERELQLGYLSTPCQ